MQVFYYTVQKHCSCYCFIMSLSFHTWLHSVCFDGIKEDSVPVSQTLETCGCVFCVYVDCNGSCMCSGSHTGADMKQCSRDKRWSLRKPCVCSGHTQIHPDVTLSAVCLTLFIHSDACSSASTEPIILHASHVHYDCLPWTWIAKAVRPHITIWNMEIYANHKLLIRFHMYEICHICITQQWWLYKWFNAQ